MPVGAAIPLISTGVSALLSRHSANSAKKQAQPLIDAQTQAAQYSTGLSKTLADVAGQQFNLAQPALTRALNYYTTTASGSRPQIDQLLAPQYSQISDYYRGGQNSLQRDATGANRDRSMGDLIRDRSNQLALLPMQARASGVQGMSSLGTSLMSSGTSLYGAAANANNQSASQYGNVLDDLRSQQKLSYDRSQAFGAALMKLIGGTDWKKLFSGSGGGGNPSGFGSGYPAGFTGG